MSVISLRRAAWSIITVPRCNYCRSYAKHITYHEKDSWICCFPRMILKNCFRGIKANFRSLFSVKNTPYIRPVLFSVDSVHIFPFKSAKCTSQFSQWPIFFRHNHHISTYFSAVFPSCHSSIFLIIFYAGSDRNGLRNKPSVMIYTKSVDQFFLLFLSNISHNVP